MQRYRYRRNFQSIGIGQYIGNIGSDTYIGGTLEHSCNVLNELARNSETHSLFQAERLDSTHFSSTRVAHQLGELAICWNPLHMLRLRGQAISHPSSLSITAKTPLKHSNELRYWALFSRFFSWWDLSFLLFGTYYRREVKNIRHPINIANW